jgi:hypothetical protein
MTEYLGKDTDYVPGSEPDHEGGSDSLVGKKSPGVLRMEALSAHISSKDRIAIFLSVFLIAYAYGLDGTLRYTYQPTATNAFANHSLLSTISVVRAVIAAAAQVSRTDSIFEQVLMNAAHGCQNCRCFRTC